MHYKYLGASCFALALTWMGCTPRPMPTVTIDERLMDTVYVDADKKVDPFVRPRYNPAYTRRNDLLHTNLDVRFDWQKQYLYGKATLTLKPLFYATDQLRLDAKGFDINKVFILNSAGEKELRYRYEDDKNLYITLDRQYSSQEEYKILVDYTAKPNELPIGGSKAITQDKGLYFINPLKKEKGKPQQIWTQGETESSSCWFPTIDRPNERCTQEIRIRVQDKYKTLSNGLLISSTPNGDGTRTDYWKMDLPHAPYLFMMAVGEFAVIKDEWEGMLLEYYVEPKYAKDAKNIYPYTAEMLSFFSKRLGVRYPWPKYSQVVTRDYVSGAMENTTAVIFGDFVQKTSRELLDQSDLNEGIVAHEMMHHWFGDLVTCESWANLPLNESFANYSEYLWFEHKHGKAAADHLRLRETKGYLSQAATKAAQHPLIYYGYKDKEDMFDAHSYNKGGAILHMLRNYLGDDAFFEALKVYLTENKYTAAEVHQLRMAFEKVSGEDLNWFFNQWFFTKGHPKLTIYKTYNDTTKTLEVTVEQTQNHEESTVFVLPFAIDIYQGSEQYQRKEVLMTKEKQVFSFPMATNPSLVLVDPDCMLLCERTYKKTTEEYVEQYLRSENFINQRAALLYLRDSQKNNPEVAAVFQKALAHPFWGVREMAIDYIKVSDDKKADLIKKMASLAQKDARSQVRNAAVEKLATLKATDQLDLVKRILQTDSSYLVMQAALNTVHSFDGEQGLKMAESLEQTSSEALLMSVSKIFMKSRDKKYVPFFEKNWRKCNNYNAYVFFANYVDLVKSLEDEALNTKVLKDLVVIAKDLNTTEWKRYAAASGIKQFRDHYYGKNEEVYQQILQDMKAIKANETSSTLVKLYKRWGVE